MPPIARHTARRGTRDRKDFSATGGSAVSALPPA